ncbi:MAG: hypothetical protein KJZ65_09775 [Phycisphaerales bacterium]|nr:hypothetical protein [Phycisphaerales bacterium]
MDKRTVTLLAVIVAILLGALLIVRANSGGASGGAKAPDRAMVVSHMANLPVEQLKFTRAKWAAQLDMYRQAAGVKKETIVSAERNLAELDKILVEKGVDPSTITSPTP